MRLFIYKVTLVLVAVAMVLSCRNGVPIEGTCESNKREALKNFRDQSAAACRGSRQIDPIPYGMAKSCVLHNGDAGYMYEGVVDCQPENLWDVDPK